MIPTFPEFKPLEWGDKTEVLHFTDQFPPYSDYNFVSMWCWNTRHKMQLSQLHGNLAILFYDYLTEAPFLSFIGKYRPCETATALLDYSMHRYQENNLRLIPHSVAELLPDTKFSVLPDADAHDYVISVDHLCSFETLSNNQSQAAYWCKKFLQLYPHCHVTTCHSKDLKPEPYVELFKRWAKAKNLDHFELNEYSAFERFIQQKDCDNHIVSLYDRDKMIAFSTYELLGNGYAICHFSKADIAYTGIFDGLTYTVGKVLRERGVQYWNFEQDLGIETLRRAKKKYAPAFYLKKYIVSRR